MRLRKSVFLHREPEMFALFDLDSGLLSELNPAGTVICQALQNETSENDIAEMLSNALPEVPKSVLARDVAGFAAQLGEKGLLQKDGSRNIPGKSAAPLPNNRILFDRFDMRQVFGYGMVPVVADTPLQDFKTGDIVCYRSDDPGAVYAVSRVVKKRKDVLWVRGDSQRGGSASEITADRLPQLAVYAARPDGRRFRLKNGKSGLVQFYVNRMKTRFLCLLDRLLPLMYWRKCRLQKTEPGSVTKYFYRRKLVAIQQGGHLEFCPERNRYRFKIEQ